ncbi:MAG: polysaccharide biosynthesis protein [Chloroflexi bacterium]|jgi:FlaA1/EpsC-like NDP-sugar epimerase|nr:polysaccharide biosynthesis protein [Chloroflexota bacterium]MBT3670927.1 polysaccharide biosynthesis protein [Chloroflexota bacterium]MBT4003399.1 polysaccharide biosynthesis protein [Chloroflexota bacterium]MBT4306359.1 polysaccharide biosynthesis protein [Chloroflexota bacterium]MBT4532760.1 polysaccharide biosynthesis protein [Chloroflexota bacterium]
MKPQFHLRNRYIFSLDLILIVITIFLSFLIRLEFLQVLRDYIPTILWMIALSFLIKPFIYRKFGLYQRFWIYASSREALIVTLGAILAAIIVGLVMLGLQALQVFALYPRSVIIIDILFSILAVGGVRFLPRFIAEGFISNRSKSGVKQVLIVGAGDAGALVVRELQKNPQLKINPIAFLDDDPEKQDFQILNIPVVGKLENLAEKIDELLIDEVIIAVPSAPGRVVRQVAEVCSDKSMPFRTMPGVYELLGGTVSVNRLREVNITDLLRRNHTPIDDDRVSNHIRGKRVLITGAGGSIAGELCRQITRWDPAELVLVGHGENSLFEMLLELRSNHPQLDLHPVVVDVRNKRRLEQIFTKFQPEVVFHAAAHKHVPMMEKNVEEAVTNNIFGTKNVVEVAAKHQVPRLVMISSDKAVAPTSVMGATKRIAELVVLNAANQSGLDFSVVRFGNVLGSRGSVVPLFKRQIADGGPITVTHPDIERYFMTIPEAVHLVLQAFSMGTGGEVFVLDMGKPVRIYDLASDLIKLSGLEPGLDIEIEVTGLRPGEKLYEELWDENSTLEKTDHPEITRLLEEGLLSEKDLQVVVSDLISLAEDGKVEDILTLLDETIPGAQIRNTPAPGLTAII